MHHTVSHEDQREEVTFPRPNLAQEAGEKHVDVAAHGARELIPGVLSPPRPWGGRQYSRHQICSPGALTVGPSRLRQKGTRRQVDEITDQVRRADIDHRPIGLSRGVSRFDVHDRIFGEGERQRGVLRERSGQVRLQPGKEVGAEMDGSGFAISGLPCGEGSSENGARLAHVSRLEPERETFDPRVEPDGKRGVDRFPDRPIRRPGCEDGQVSPHRDLASQAPARAEFLFGELSLLGGGRRLQPSGAAALPFGRGEGDNPATGALSEAPALRTQREASDPGDLEDGSVLPDLDSLGQIRCLGLRSGGEAVREW